MKLFQNTVVRELVSALMHQYKVQNIFGIEYGYRGFYSLNLRSLDMKAVAGACAAGPGEGRRPV